MLVYFVIILPQLYLLMVGVVLLVLMVIYPHIPVLPTLKNFLIPHVLLVEVLFMILVIPPTVEKLDV